MKVALSFSSHSVLSNTIRDGLTVYLVSLSGTKDAFDVYHSQIRMDIECACCILMNRRGALYAPIPLIGDAPKMT